MIIGHAKSQRHDMILTYKIQIKFPNLFGFFSVTFALYYFPAGSFNITPQASIHFLPNSLFRTSHP